MQGIENDARINRGKFSFDAVMNQYCERISPPKKLEIEFSCDPDSPESTVKFHRAVDLDGVEHDTNELHISSMLHEFKMHLSRFQSVE